jgi:ribosome-associated protein
MTSKELVKIIVTALDNKKTEDIKVVKVEGLTSITDFFVIATANSTTQVKAAADEVEFLLKQKDILPNKIDGYQNAEWIALDYYQVIVHVFNRDTREFYSLEKLWRDGEILDTSDFLDGGKQ